MNESKEHLNPKITPEILSMINSDNPGCDKEFNPSLCRVRHMAAKLREERGAEIEIPEAVLNRLSGKYRDQPIISDPEADDLAPTCVAHYHKDRSTRLVRDRAHPLGVRPYTVREYARLQGVPDWFKFDCPDNAAYKAIGNGVPVPFGRWVGGEIVRYFQ